jgi:formylglycine-generating enzyme required for sulfatase activity
MKSISKVLGIIVFVMIIGLFVSGCGSPAGGGSPEHEHTEGEWIIDDPATEEAAGNKHKECTVCGEELEQEEIPQLEPGHTHEWDDEWQHNETHHWKECTAGDLVKTEEAAHMPSEWITDTEATEQAAGSKHTECTECERILETESIPKLPPSGSASPVGPHPDNPFPHYESEVLEDLELNQVEEVVNFPVGYSNTPIKLSPFWISKYEVTQEQYTEVMGSNPSKFKDNPAAGETQGKRPVELINWYDMIVFCNKLSIAEGLPPAYYMNTEENTDPAAWGAIPTTSNTAWDTGIQCNFKAGGYRLPTEAEWEYAARGGHNDGEATEYINNNPETDAVAWYAYNSDQKTHEVGLKEANALGIYDMAGNVYEWCWDWIDPVIYPYTQDDPTGASSGVRRASRGGSWSNSAVDLRSAIRGFIYPSDRGDGAFGFRLVRP